MSIDYQAHEFEESIARRFTAGEFVEFLGLDIYTIIFAFGLEIDEKIEEIATEIGFKLLEDSDEDPSDE